MYQENDCKHLKKRGAVAFFDWDGNGKIEPWEMALSFSLFDEEEEEDADDLALFEDDDFEDEEEY